MRFICRSTERTHNGKFASFKKSTTDSSPVEILISGQGADYINLAKSRLHVKAKIVNANGSALAVDEKIINLPLQSIWSQIEIFLNRKLVSFNTTNFPYRAYIKTILGASVQHQESVLQTQLFEKDTPPMNRRYFFTKESQSFDLQGVLFEDLFSMDKYLINGVDVFIRMYFTTPQLR